MTQIPGARRGAGRRLERAFAMLIQRTGDGTCPQEPTIAELCRLASVSRNSVYRYHPEILATLRDYQRRSAPGDPAVESPVRSATSDCASLQNQVSKLAALVDHYYGAYREVCAMLDRRDREISDLRRKLDGKPSPLRR
jgi:hypothetical protein